MINSAQDAINVANMERIKNTFSQYMFDTHIQGHPHLPTMPDNEDYLMDDEWENTVISDLVVPGRDAIRSVWWRPCSSQHKW